MCLSWMNDQRIVTSSQYLTSDTHSQKKKKTYTHRVNELKNENKKRKRYHSNLNSNWISIVDQKSFLVQQIKNEKKKKLRARGRETRTKEIPNETYWFSLNGITILCMTLTECLNANEREIVAAWLNLESVPKPLDGMKESQFDYTHTHTFSFDRFFFCSFFFSFSFFF